ncbi:MAG: SH3 domain-containing protein [Anaerolineales bacterium]|nr:SH3 domain-containing protein [Anaerolineales bacterium]
MRKVFGLALALSVIISSCNLPNAGAPDPQIATAAALTVQAAISTTSNQQPLASPTAGNTTSDNSPTPTYSKPFVSVGDVTNCRTGPGVNYERVTQILPSDSVEIIGFFPPNYWIVSTSAGNCWVSGEFTTPAGSYASVPTVTAPPTPQGGELEKVSLQKWDVSCNYETNEANIIIRWTDKDGESGYRILRNNEVVAELAANSTQFTEVISLLSGQSVGYNIVAFNAAGSASSSTVTLSC